MSEPTDEEILLEMFVTAASERDPAMRAVLVREVFQTQKEHTLRERVKAFHVKFGHPVATVPAVPSAERLYFRLQLITEEYLELLLACGLDLNSQGMRYLGQDLRAALWANFEDIHPGEIPEGVDLPALVDALDDLDYVIEGTRLVCGVDGRPTARAVHEANMVKEPVLDANGKPDAGKKPTKPAGWKEPNTAALLERQGWQRSIRRS